jgi:cobalt-zinc-cadmium efflux system protein
MNSHNHNHSHSHEHQHHHAHNTSFRVLIIAVVLIVCFAVVEAISGWFSNSLALLGDAGHMASDGIALSIAAFASWLSVRPPTDKHSYGMGRAEVIAAWFTSLMMILISFVVIAEAVKRINEPVQVHGAIVIIVATLGLAVNGFVAWMLTRSEKTLNIRAALLHVIGDLLGSVAALIAGIVIVETGWYPIDPILSIVIGILILISSFRLFRESMHVLMEGVPQNIQIDRVSESLKESNGVKAVHDLHVWTLSSGKNALSAHISIKELSEWDSVLKTLRTLLKEEFGIVHITLQPEPELIDCNPCNEPK